MNCKYCGKEIADGAVFCKYCGERADGLRTCPVCGKDVEGDSAFCSFCGADMNAAKAKKVAANRAANSEVAVAAAANAGVAKTSSVTLHKVMNWVLLGLASAVALFAFVFIFLIGVQEIASLQGEINHSTAKNVSDNIFYYFSKTYKNRDDALKLLELQGEDASSYYKFATLLPCILGTMVAAGSFVAVIALSVTYLVFTIQFALGKRTKRADGLAIAAAAVYVFCAAAIKALSVISISATEIAQSYNEIERSGMSAYTALNPATIAGVVLCAVFVGLWLCAKVVDMGKKALKADFILKACLSFAGIAIAVVVVSLLSLPALNNTTKEVEEGYSTIYTYTQDYKFGSMNLIQVLGSFFSSEVPDDYSTKAWVSLVMGMLAYLTAVGAIFSGGSYIVKSMKNMTAENNDDNPLAASIWTVILAALTMVFVIVQGSMAKDIFSEMESSFGEKGFSYGMPIAAFVLSIVPLVLTIVQNVLCKKNVAAAAVANVNQVNYTDNTQA